MPDYQGLLALLVANLVDHPDEARIQRLERQGEEVYRLTVHPDDLGKLIGKGGQTARALRMLLTAAAARLDRRVGLEIVE
jgi:uncharacterized protein